MSEIKCLTQTVLQWINLHDMFLHLHRFRYHALKLLKVRSRKVKVHKLCPHTLP